MARPLRIEYPGAFYHITSRGNEQKDVFRTIADREKFLSYMETASERYGAVIHVYCLMSNHYHLLLETPLDNLSQIMRHINGAYTTYFNAAHHRSGHLFQGRYKALVVEADVYAAELSRYIHVNPVRAGMAEEPGRYAWSSYRFYVGQAKAPAWLNTGFILDYFGRKVSDAHKGYREFVHAINDFAYESPLSKVVASTILGGVDFVKKIAQKYLTDKQVSRDLPALRALSERPTIEGITKDVRTKVGGDERLVKSSSIYFCHQYSGRSLKEIGAYFGISESAVTQASRRFTLSMAKDRKLRKKVEKIKDQLKLSNV